MEKPTVLDDQTEPRNASPSRKGRAVMSRQQINFRRKKNNDMHAEIQPELLRRLKISELINLNAIKLQSSIPPARIPITFRGLPRFVEEVWLRMKSIGTRPFSVQATEANYAVFLKCILYIAESRVVYAQMKCKAVPPFPMTSLLAMSEMQLRTIKQQSSRLPFPLVMYMEAIGNFTIRKQPVVPVEMRTTTEAATGAVSFFPSSIAKVLDACRCDIQADNLLYNMSQFLSSLPNIRWINDQRNVAQPAAPGNQQPAEPARVVQTIRVAPESIEFWRFPTPSEWMIFSQIITSMESKRGFLFQFDVSSGFGSSLQIIRFPKVLDVDEHETLYYMNDEVPEFEVKLAPALLLGAEHQSTTFGRFSSNYTECLIHGSASQSKIRHAVIWADNM